MNTNQTKLTFQQVDAFFREWNKDKKDQRFGQAFLNKFYPQANNPDLFYSEDNKKSLEIIYRQYTDFTA